MSEADDMLDEIAEDAPPALRAWIEARRATLRAAVEAAAAVPSRNDAWRHTPVRDPSRDAVTWRPKAVEYTADGREKGLVILSCGLGRDSMTMLCLLIEGRLLGPDGVVIQPADLDCVVFSDTGYEWGFTYDVIPTVEKMLAPYGIPFFHLQKPPTHAWSGWAAQKRAIYLHAAAEWDRLAAHIPVVKEPKAPKVTTPKVEGKALASFKERAAARLAQYDADLSAFATYTKLVEPANALYTRIMSPASRLPCPWQEDAGATIAARAVSGYYHSAAPIMDEYAMYNRITTRVRAECTVRHKIAPIDACVSDVTHAKYGVRQLGRGRSAKADSWEKRVAAGDATPHRVLIGFTADENNRVERSADAAKDRLWKQECYPLVVAGIGKDDEGAILARHGLDWVRKSGCFMCHWQPESWYWALRERHPREYARVVAYEASAISRNPAFCIRGTKPIDAMVNEWRAAHPHATVESVLDKTYARGF